MERIEVVFWGTRSYDVRTTAFVDKKDYDVAFEQVGTTLLFITTNVGL